MFKTSVLKSSGVISKSRETGGRVRLNGFGVLRDATSKATINRDAKSIELLTPKWSICEGIHDKMAVGLLKTDKVSDGSKSSDKKSVYDPNFGSLRNGPQLHRPRTQELLTANGLTST